MSDLSKIREEIDATDKEIIKLLEKRIGLSKEVAIDKIKTGKKIFDKGREIEKLDSVKNIVSDPANASDMQSSTNRLCQEAERFSIEFLKKKASQCFSHMTLWMKYQIKILRWPIRVFPEHMLI